MSQQRDDTDSPTVLFGLVSWIFLLLALLRGEARQRVGDTVLVQMPQCDICSAAGAPAPIRVNSEELIMTFVVHQTFKQHVLAAAGQHDSPGAPN